jgi:broad specificity phosphatase PhoE
MMLVLVRHAMPAYGPEVPADEWVLSPDGHQEAAVLATLLPVGAHLVSSAEPKAFQTLEPAGAVHRDVRFNEIRRDEPFDSDWREVRRAYVSGTDHAGWEPREEVADRFDAGITDHVSQAADRPVVVASHGMAMTVWLNARIGLRDPGLFWSDLRLPDAYVVDLQTDDFRRLRRAAPRNVETSSPNTRSALVQVGVGFR